MRRIKTIMSKINPHTEENVSSRGLHRFAEDFFNAYNIISEKGHVTIQVRYYLLCHSFELSMKSVLREVGYTPKQLQGFGHDLEKISRELEINPETRVLWSKEEKDMIKIANMHYVTKEMEYFTKGPKRTVDFNDFAKFLSVWLRISHITIVEISERSGRGFPSIF